MLRYLLAFAAALLVVAAPANAALPGANISATKTIPRPTYPGTQRLHFEYGPIDIVPGQNTIETSLDNRMPDVPGFITRFAPNLIYAGTRAVPPVDVIHLHHAVWLTKRYPTFAAGEEKTVQQLPSGYGLPYTPDEPWGMFYMIHNLTPNPTQVYLTYDIDLAPPGTSLTPVHPLWMDVAGINPYPVFDAIKGRSRFTFPNDAGKAQRSKVGAAHEFTVPDDMTLVSGSGHIHPGGLYTDLTVTRGKQKRRVFRSEAKYFEPAGAVSWDVAMTHTRPDWRVALKRGDRVNVSATYDTSRASWYESMGIDSMFVADGIQPEALDPFTAKVDWHGLLSHGHLPENNHHGGSPIGLPDARTLIAGPRVQQVDISGFNYGRSDLAGSRRLPTVTAGRSLTFRNLDATRGITPQASAYHTITACRAPCTGETGIAYPLANAGVQFDSGELGFGPPGLTPAANTNTWSTPRDLKPGTYTYFCRIHPFMRGAFRVITARGRAASGS